MSLNKKASNLIPDNSIELIIAAAGIIVMIFVLVALFSPVYDEYSETAKSYLGMVNEQIHIADSGGEGSLTFWAPDPEGIKFYLVYFGDVSSFDKGGMDFVTRKRNKNTICVCYGNKDGMNCKNCKELDLPVEFSESAAPWILNPVRKLNITKTAENYLFSK